MKPGVNSGNLIFIHKFEGLRSKLFFEENCLLNQIKCGGNPLSHCLDKEIGNWDMISLNFKPNTPLACTKKKENHLIFIEISNEVATYENVIFTDCNATRTRNSQRRGEGIEGLKQVRFEMIHRPHEPWNQEWKKYVQAEILVPKYIPLTSFKGIHFISEASQNLGELYWGEKSDLFLINEDAHADIDSHNKRVFQFPFVKNFIITNREVNKENIHMIQNTQNFISRNEIFYVIIYVNLPPGSTLCIKIEQMDITKSWKTERIIEGAYWEGFIAPINTDFLDIKIYIDRVLWAFQKAYIKN